MTEQKLHGAQYQQQKVCDLVERLARTVPKAILDYAQELLLVHELPAQHTVDVAASDLDCGVILEDFFHVVESDFGG